MKEWEVIRNPDKALLEEIAAAVPENPFWTPAYLESRRRLGEEVLVLAAGEVRCPALGRTGRVTRSVEVPSVPPLAPAHPFWSAVLDWREREGIGRLELNTFGSPVCVLPRLAGPWRRRPRAEYVLDLRAADLIAGWSTNHARNVKRARKANLTVERTAADAACESHVALMQASMDRRRQRGEAVPEDRAESLRRTRALVGAGAAALFQAQEDGAVRSSILVLLAPRGGYYHSAGSSPEGMSRGASHLLVLEIAERLRADGCAQFNLGGVSEPGSGLERFKSGFGTTCIALEALEGEWPRTWTVVRKGWEKLSINKYQ